jgi:hypothetical protein
MFRAGIKGISIESGLQISPVQVLLTLRKLVTFQQRHFSTEDVSSIFYQNIEV